MNTELSLELLPTIIAGISTIIVSLIFLKGGKKAIGRNTWIFLGMLMLALIILPSISNLVTPEKPKAIASCQTDGAYVPTKIICENESLNYTEVIWSATFNGQEYTTARDTKLFEAIAADSGEYTITLNAVNQTSFGSTKDRKINFFLLNPRPEPEFVEEIRTKRFSFNSRMPRTETRTIQPSSTNCTITKANKKFARLDNSKIKAVSLNDNTVRIVVELRPELHVSPFKGNRSNARAELEIEIHEKCIAEE